MIKFVYAYTLLFYCKWVIKIQIIALQLIIYALAVLAKTKYLHCQLIKIWLFQNVNVGTTEKNY